MSALTIQILRVIIVIALAGSLVVQVLIVPSAYGDLTPPGGGGPFSYVLATIAVLGVLALQVIGVSILRLLVLVRKGRVFSPRAFRWVDLIIGAVAAEAVLVFGVAVTAAIANRTHPGDELAPGAIGMICGVALVIAGVALVIAVQRQLLVQAVEARDRAADLQSELDEVI